MAKFVVAIDGVAGSGKSTTAKGVARRLNFLYIDTGAMYRAFTLKYLRAVSAREKAIDCELIQELLTNTLLDLRRDNSEEKVFLDGEDVSAAIRTPEVSCFVSQISAVPAVREWMVAKQREVAEVRALSVKGAILGQLYSQMPR